MSAVLFIAKKTASHYLVGPAVLERQVHRGIHQVLADLDYLVYLELQDFQHLLVLLSDPVLDHQAYRSLQLLQEFLDLQ